MEAISKINQDLEVVVVSGPAINKKFENVKNLGFVDNLHELIFAADLVISLAGKSTIDEANAYGTPAIFIPIKGHFEQEDNAKRQGFWLEDCTTIFSAIVHFNLVYKYNVATLNGEEMKEQKKRKKKK